MTFDDAVNLLDSIAAQLQLKREEHLKLVEAVQVIRGDHERAIAQIEQLKAKDAPLHRDAK